MKQAHNREANDSEDPTTANANKKEVEDLTLEPEVADKVIEFYRK